MEKLLVKDRFKRRGDDSRLEWFRNKEGNTFLAPADRDNKINGLCKWESAFRVYSAIYSKVNPHRVAEIWQYIYVINTTAANFVWENVAFYDFTFRQMMALNPQCSWAKTYNQMWNLAMHEPLHQGQQSRANFRNKNNEGNRRFRRPCWKYNKNQSCGPNCDFEHKCSYCGNGHAVIDCNKLRLKQDDGHGRYHKGRTSSATDSRSPKNKN